ncbi:GDSL lipase/esterase [Penicillium angulare]|uniref:GDSL lipase/esterase n=1 Tax=Penicillium angulare TaxID=116970 RepID=A0A9W9JSW3_9EURO|nr:GDSL lipase/esterase [Penicillium angulare]
METYSRLLHELYLCGARRFLLINVPPISRTPYFLALESWQRERHEFAVDLFNVKLKSTSADWLKDSDHSNVTLEMYDAWSFMTTILDQSETYGFLNNECSGERCIWWDNYHPTTEFHHLLAADIQGSLKNHI